MKRTATVILFLLPFIAAAQFQLNGPDHPRSAFQYMNGQLQITLYNWNTSNNYMEMYSEYDPSITGYPDSVFEFQGYIVYQAIDNTVTPQDIHDLSKMRVVAQCDIADNIDTLVNYTYDPSSGVCLGMTEVEGANTGITHNMAITHDAFTGNPFSPTAEYCFYAIAYAYNPYKEDTSCAPLKKPFLTSYSYPTCIVPGSLSISGLSKAAELSIEPNPATDQIKVNTTGSGGRLLIMDTAGRMVKEASIDASATVDVSGLSAGSYIAVYFDENGNLSRKKLLKQ